MCFMEKALHEHIKGLGKVSVAKEKCPCLWWIEILQVIMTLHNVLGAGSGGKQKGIAVRKAFIDSLFSMAGWQHNGNMCSLKCTSPTFC